MHHIVSEYGSIEVDKDTVTHNHFQFDGERERERERERAVAGKEKRNPILETSMDRFSCSTRSTTRKSGHPKQDFILLVPARWLWRETCRCPRRTWRVSWPMAAEG